MLEIVRKSLQVLIALCVVYLICTVPDWAGAQEELGRDLSALAVSLFGAAIVGGIVGGAIGRGVFWYLNRPRAPELAGPRRARPASPDEEAPQIFKARKPA